MKNNIYAIAACTLLVSCSSAPLGEPRRSLASITQFPAVSSAGYSNTTFDSYLAQLNRGRPAKNKLKLSDIVIPEHTDYYDELNAQYEEVLNGVIKLLHNPKAPRPKLLIVKTGVVNAQVAGENACLNAEFSILGDYAEGKPKDAPGVKLEPYALSGFREMELERSAKMYATLASPVDDFIFAQQFHSACPEISEGNGQELVRDLAKHQLDYAGTLCRIHPGSSPARFDCPKTAAAYTFRQALYQRALPFVFVNAGLIASMNSFEEFKAIVAHELGHYYLGHLYTMTSPRGYFYDRTAGGDAFRPPEDPSLVQMGNDLLAVGNLTPGRTIPGMFGHSIAGEALISATRGLQMYKGTRERPWRFDQKKCAPFFQGNAQVYLARPFLYGNDLSAAEKQKWERYFTQLRECTRSVVAASKDDADYLRYFQETPPRTSVMDYLLRGYKAPKVANAWEAFTLLEPYMTAQANRLHDHQALHKVGYYTLEEEADIFGLNYLLANGYSPSLMQAALASLSRAYVKREKGQGPEAECLDAYEHGWQRNGQPYVPQPLKYDDLHHGFCFRLYDVVNLSKRLGGYETAATPAASAGYAAVRERYRQIVAGLPLGAQ